MRYTGNNNAKTYVTAKGVFCKINLRGGSGTMNGGRVTNE